MSLLDSILLVVFPQFLPTKIYNKITEIPETPLPLLPSHAKQSLTSVIYSKQCRIIRKQRHCNNNLHC